MDQQHALVEHAEVLEPLDLGRAERGEAAVMGRVRKTRVVGLQQGAARIGELLQAFDQLVRGVVEAAERGADRDPPVMRAVV